MEGFESIQNRITETAEKARESVVSINSTQLIRNGYSISPVRGAGSGFIIDSSGYIITNNHVVENSEDIEITLYNGETFYGKVVGTDKQTDLAVLKIERSDLHPLKFGNSEEAKVGQMVIAIGNAMGLPGGHTISFGVIGAKNRPMPWANFVLEGLIQTDAAVNPGNSGGPLMDLYGNVLGVNTAIIPYAQGIGFSIPSNTVKQVFNDIISYGTVKRKYLGISGINADEYFSRENKHGVLVVDLDAYGPAHEAGIRPGDIIISIDNSKIENMKDLISGLSKANDTAELIILRDGNKYKSTVNMKHEPHIIKIE